MGAVTSSPSPAPSNVSSTGATVGTGVASSSSIPIPANTNVAAVGSAAAAAVAAYTQANSFTAPSLIALGQSVGGAVSSAPQTSIAVGAAIAVPAFSTLSGANVGTLVEGMATALPGFAGLGALASALYLATTTAVGPSDDSAVHSLGLGIVSPAAELPDDVGEVTDAVGEGEPAKVVPNPYGKKGGPAHQAGVAEALADLTKKYEDDPNIKVKTEVRVDTPDGQKKSRYLDVGAIDIDQDDVVAGVQVGRQTIGGIPVARERQARDDIVEAKPGLPVDFLPIKNK